MSKEELRQVTASDGWLRSFVRRWTKSDADADDVVQDAYLQLLRAIDLAEHPIENASAWLYRTARNLLINRSKRHRELLPDEGLEVMTRLLVSDDDSPDTEMLRQMVWEELEAALAELPDEQCAAFVRTELDGLSVKEAAMEQGVSVNTLLSRKHYAVKHLRRRLADIYRELTEP